MAASSADALVDHCIPRIGAIDINISGRWFSFAHPSPAVSGRLQPALLLRLWLNTNRVRVLIAGFRRSVELALSESNLDHDNNGSASASASGSQSYYDRWGFRVDHDPRAAMHSLRLQQEASNAVAEWERYFHDRGNSPLQGPKVGHLKEMVRRGIPDRYRKKMWNDFVLMHVQKYLERRAQRSNVQLPFVNGVSQTIDSYYRSLIKANLGKESVATRQIELDLLRTFPTHRDYTAYSSERIKALRRVLVAYSWHNPEIGYCQGLNMLAGWGLLVLEENMVFWLLVATAQQILPRKYYTNYMEEAQADQRVFQDLLHERLPKLSAHFEKHQVDTGMVTFNWFLVVFVECVPAETCFRIWDCFLYEGSKVQFRLALGIFSMHQAQIMKADTREELFDLLRVIPKQLYDVDSVIKKSFSGLNGLQGFSMSTITEKRAKHLTTVEAEMRAQWELEAARAADEREREAKAAARLAAAEAEASAAAVATSAPTLDEVDPLGGDV